MFQTRDDDTSSPPTLDNNGRVARVIVIGSYLFSVVEVVANHMVRFHASHNTSQHMSRIACEYLLLQSARRFVCSFAVFSVSSFALSFIPSMIVYSFVVSSAVPFLPLRLYKFHPILISSIVYSFAVSSAVVVSTYNFDSR